MDETATTSDPHDASRPTTAFSPRSPGAVAWGIVALLLIVTVAVVAVIGVAGARDQDVAGGSPEAALQRYFAAWDAGDPATAWALLSRRAQAGISLRDFEDARDWLYAGGRIWVDQASADGADRATLTVTIEHTYRGLLGDGRDRERTRIPMVREDGDWKIDTPLVGYARW